MASVDLTSVQELLGHKPLLLVEILVHNYLSEKKYEKEIKEIAFRSLPDYVVSLSSSKSGFDFRKTILIQKTKNGKPKTLPLNKFALDVLNRRSKMKSIKNDLVFFNKNGRKIHVSNLRKSFYRVMGKVGIKDFRFHDLRHTFASRLAQAGVDLYKISKLLGHKDIKMTQRYSHHCSDSLRDGVEILESDYNLTTMEKKRGFVACPNSS